MLAKAMLTNPVVVRRVMGGLRDRGYVRSEKGHGGGCPLPAGAVLLVDGGAQAAVSFGKLALQFGNRGLILAPRQCCRHLEPCGKTLRRHRTSHHGQSIFRSLVAFDEASRPAAAADISHRCFPAALATSGLRDEASLTQTPALELLQQIAGYLVLGEASQVTRPLAAFDPR